MTAKAKTDSFDPLSSSFGSRMLGARSDDFEAGMALEKGGNYMEGSDLNPFFLRGLGNFGSNQSLDFEGF